MARQAPSLIRLTAETSGLRDGWATTRTQLGSPTTTLMPLAGSMPTTSMPPSGTRWVLVR
jgi:hypothetical protein